jgi:hypothetical protein
MLSARWHETCAQHRNFQVVEELAAIVTSLNATDMHNAALSFDIRKRGLGRFPEDATSKDRGLIEGPIIAQISEVVDISRPSTAIGKSRQSMLFCQVSDGRVNCGGLIIDSDRSSLGTDTPPGTKIRLLRAPIEHGLVLLDGSCMQARLSTASCRRIVSVSLVGFHPQKYPLSLKNKGFSISRPSPSAPFSSASCRIFEGREKLGRQ